MSVTDKMPRMQTGDKLIEALRVVPDYDAEIQTKSQAERLLALNDVCSLYLQSEMGTEIYAKLYLALARSLKKKESRLLTVHRNINASAIRTRTESFGGILGGIDCMTIIGESGIGKSRSIERAVSLLEGERVIELTEPFAKIIPVLNIQCPYDASCKAMLLSICKKADEALGTNYYEMQIRSRAATNMLIVSVAQMMINHCGLLIIDEIQNLVKHKAGVQLIGMLTQLLNESGVAVVMVGTPEVVPFFESIDYLARRTVGLNYERCAYDVFFYDFCCELWKYQYVSDESEISDAIIHYLYEHSAGKLSNVIFLFYTAQEIGILNGRECIDISSLEEAYKRMRMLHSHIQPEVRVEARTNVRKRKTSKQVLTQTKNIYDPGEAWTINDFSFSEAARKAKSRNLDVLDILTEHISITELGV